jgi:hypothetical protein
MRLRGANRGTRFFAPSVSCLLSSVLSAQRYREYRFAISLQLTTLHHAST